MNREAIMAALLAQVATSAFATSGRRLIPWSQVTEQPAIFVRHIKEEHPPRPLPTPPRATIHAEVWIYAKTPDPSDVPDSTINPLIDAVEAALVPSNAELAVGRGQTLGGLVNHCWIEGTIEVDPGDLDSQAIAVIPVKILVPS